MIENKSKIGDFYHKQAKVNAKNFFIPHEGNNYEPHFLRPRRLFGYAVGSVAIKLIIFVFVTLLPLTAWVTPDIATDQAQKIISLTNEIRTNLKLEPLKENKVLSEAAYDKVQDMIIGQYFAHVNSKNQGLKYWLSKANYNYITAGENLAMGFAEPQDVVNAWQNSKTHYQNIINPSFKEIGVALDSGQYEGYDTTFVAQFFALPSKMAVKEVLPLPEVSTAATSTGLTAETTTISKTEVSETVATTSNSVVSNAPEIKTVDVEATATPEVSNILKEVLGQVVESQPLIDFKPMASSTNAITENKIELTFADEDQNEQQKRIVMADGYLVDGVIKAEINFANNTLLLQPDDSIKNRWSGSKIVFGSDDKLFNPVVLPTLTVQYADGRTETEDINWSSIKPVNPSVLDRYFFIKGRNSPYTKKLFSFSAILYKILLILAIITLLLNIFIKFKTQNYRLIAISLGFIILMIILLLL